MSHEESPKGGYVHLPAAEPEAPPDRNALPHKVISHPRRSTFRPASKLPAGVTPRYSSRHPCAEGAESPRLPREPVPRNASHRYRERGQPLPVTEPQNVTNPHVSSMLLSGRITRSRGRCHSDNRGLHARSGRTAQRRPGAGTTGPGPTRMPTPTTRRPTDTCSPAALSTRDAGRTFGRYCFLERG